MILLYLAPSSLPISPMLAEGLAATTFGRSSAAKMKNADLKFKNKCVKHYTWYLNG
jgi:hypothetical protein